MSLSLSSDNADVVGSIVTNHITADEKNHYCCTWKIEVISSYKSEVVKSPVFALSGRDKFKWQLRILSFIERNGNYDFIVGLVLDGKSDGEEVYVRFKLTTLSKKKMHECNLDSSQTFKFTKNSENMACVSSSVYSSDLGMIKCYYFLTIVCEIMIEPATLDEYSLSKDFGVLLNNQLLTDVVLSVDGKNYQAHKTILAARSSVFAAMFTNDMMETHNGVVHIEDIEGEAVEEMLRYIYTGKVKKLNDLAQVLFIAANKYDLKGLRIKCEEIMIESLSSSNAFDLLLFANSYDSNHLKSEAINFIMLTSPQLKKTSAWESICQYPQLLREISEAVLSPKFTAFELN